MGHLENTLIQTTGSMGTAQTKQSWAVRNMGWRRWDSWRIVGESFRTSTALPDKGKIRFYDTETQNEAIARSIWPM